MLHDDNPLQHHLHLLFIFIRPIKLIFPSVSIILRDALIQLRAMHYAVHLDFS